MTRPSNLPPGALWGSAEEAEYRKMRAHVASKFHELFGHRADTHVEFDASTETWHVTYAQRAYTFQVGSDDDEYRFATDGEDVVVRFV